MLCFTQQPLAMPAFSKFVECVSAYIERNQKISSKTLPFPQVQHNLNEFEFSQLSLPLSLFKHNLNCTLNQAWI